MISDVFRPPQRGSAPASSCNVQECETMQHGSWFGRTPAIWDELWIIMSLISKVNDPEDVKSNIGCSMCYIVSGHDFPYSAPIGWQGEWCSRWFWMTAQSSLFLSNNLRTHVFFFIIPVFNHIPFREIGRYLNRRSIAVAIDRWRRHIIDKIVGHLCVDLYQNDG